MLYDPLDNDGIANVGKPHVVLPSSHPGSPRDLQRYQDALAIVSNRGMRSLLLPMTSNSQWKEIIARVFEMKRRQPLDDIIKKGVLGVVAGY